MTKTSKEVSKDTSKDSRRNQFLPFETNLSMKHLLVAWKQLAQLSDSDYWRDMAQKILTEANKHEDLFQDAISWIALEEHRHFADCLFSLIVSPAMQQDHILGAFVPFQLQPAFVTPPAQKWFDLIRSQKRQSYAENPEEKSRMMVAIAYSYILSHFYGLTIDMRIPYIYTVSEPDSNLLRSFRLDVNAKFTDIAIHGQLPDISESDRQYIRQNITDVDFLIQKLPPSLFTFYGFTIVSLIDVTHEEMLSQIKRQLIAQEGLGSKDNFLNMQMHIRSLLAIPELIFDVAAFRDNMVMRINSGEEADIECIYKDTKHLPMDMFYGSVYQRAIGQKQNMIIGDLQNQKITHEVDKHLQEDGINSMLLCPLIDHGEAIGIVTFYSSQPNRFSSADLLKLCEIIPLLNAAIKRGLSELDNRIQAIIQQNFTSIHPTIVWRFQRAALAILDQTNSGKVARIEPIVFDHVYPLYSATDIRASSSHRNEAIRADLSQHLHLVHDIISHANQYEPLPVFDELLFRLDEYIFVIKEFISTGDELEIIKFIRENIDPYLETFEHYGKGAKKLINKYQSNINDEYGSIYRMRKKFDDSVAIINQRISAFLDSQQPQAQAMFPHFFEKQSTDGVDFNIYIGQSLTAAKTFNRLYLKNLRLWQFIIMCRIAKLSEQLQPSLPMPLETNHLIMVQDMPLSIRFDSDEKSLHVEGAYNIRYEIMKKRIDKAVIQHNGQRLTQPGTISVVYSQQHEGREYREYIAYLVNRGFLKDELEDFLLADLQGIHGLRAFRVAVNYNQDKQSLDQILAETLKAS